jgi:mevalonate kinase
MPAFAATAPGKIILFGEHAVVYGRPAIAAPVTQVRARAVVTALPIGNQGRVQITAKDIGLDCDTNSLEQDHPLLQAIRATANQLGIDPLPALHLQVSSTIPIAAGLGSGAAVSAAIARALSAFLGHPLTDEAVSSIAFQVDQFYHGTPSGIDNTVVAYAQPVWYVRGQPFERLRVREDFTLVIGNTGVSSPTGAVVGDVRRRWQAAPEQYEPLFDKIGEITRQARRCIEQGSLSDLGQWLSQNQALLHDLDVSSPELDRLVAVAVQAGASGAKLCGAGRGGNMIALVEPDQAKAVSEALLHAGARNTIITTVRKT